VHVPVSTRRNKDGTAVRYLQPTHNVWDPATKTSRPKVLHSFGRQDQLDRDAIGRLVASLSRPLDPASALAATGPAEPAFVSSRPVGPTLVLDALWRRVGIDTVMTRLLAGRKLDPGVERVLFALLANRALEPGWKPAAARWVSRRAHIHGLPQTCDDACHRAMDGLLEIAPELECEVFWRVATLPDREVDLLFFDTTPTHFEIDDPDAPVRRDARGRPLPHPPADTDRKAPTHGEGTHGEGTHGVGFQTFGKSKDARDDPPQVVIGVAGTRAGIPARVWCWPGTTPDPALIRQARQDTRDRTPARVVWVTDRGLSPAANRREPRRGGGHHILTSSARSRARDPRRPPRRCPGPAATGTCGTTRRSNRSASPRMNG
jgi:hypothetical protein